MAERTKAETIIMLQRRRTQLEKEQEASNVTFKTLKGQGSEGASTSYNDPRVVQEMLDDVELKLQELNK